MTKDVLVSITGAHLVDGDGGNIEVITAGNYYYKNGRHYVIYDEVIDGVDGSIRNTIKIGPEIIDVIKSGAARSHLVFESQKSNISCYTTPLGQLTIGVNTNSIKVDETEDKLSVKVDYTLDVNYEEMSKCRLTMNIQSRASAQMNLGS